MDFSIISVLSELAQDYPRDRRSIESIISKIGEENPIMDLLCCFQARKRHPYIIRIIIQRTFCSSWIEAIKSFAACEHPLVRIQSLSRDRINLIERITRLPYTDIISDVKFHTIFTPHVSIQSKRIQRRREERYRNIRVYVNSLQKVFIHELAYEILKYLIFPSEIRDLSNKFL